MTDHVLMVSEYCDEVKLLTDTFNGVAPSKGETVFIKDPGESMSIQLFDGRDQWSHHRVLDIPEGSNDFIICTGFPVYFDLADGRSSNSMPFATGDHAKLIEKTLGSFTSGVPYLLDREGKELIAIHYSGSPYQKYGWYAIGNKRGIALLKRRHGYGSFDKSGMLNFSPCARNDVRKKWNSQEAFHRAMRGI